MEDQRSGHEQGRVGLGIVGRVQRLLGLGDVARRLDEAPERGHCHGVLVHPEPVDLDVAHGLLLRIEVLGPHAERSTRDEGHSVPLTSGHRF